jgi:hypothetical protein
MTDRSTPGTVPDLAAAARQNTDVFASLADTLGDDNATADEKKAALDVLAKAFPTNDAGPGHWSNAPVD